VTARPHPASNEVPNFLAQAFESRRHQHRLKKLLLSGPIQQIEAGKLVLSQSLRRYGVHKRQQPPGVRPSSPSSQFLLVFPHLIQRICRQLATYAIGGSLGVIKLNPLVDSAQNQTSNAFTVTVVETHPSERNVWREWRNVYAKQRRRTRL
jgi:hypothetical protein